MPYYCVVKTVYRAEKRFVVVFNVVFDSQMDVLLLCTHA